jgi:hypothetical protein
MIDCIGSEIAMYRSPLCIRVMIVLPALASMMAGCTDSRVAATNAGASAQGSSESSQTQRSVPYRTGYGFSSDGPTTDLYTEIFRPKAQDAPTTAASAAVPQGQAATASSAVQQKPATPQAEPAAYGISSNGPTTDLYTELFGDRSHQ